MTAQARLTMAPALLPERAESLLATARIHHTPCGGGRLAWQQWSEPDAGPPLLLIHGGFGSWTHWLANIEGLRQKRELWSLDLPGLGASADIFRAARPTHFAAIIAKGIRMLLGSRPYQLAAFSFGAMVAAELALDRDCERFAAIGAAGCAELHVQVPLTPPPGPTATAEAAASVHRDNLRALMFSPDFPIDELAVSLQANNLANARFNSRGLSRTSGFLDALPHIDAELVGIWGSEDATAGGAAGIEARRRAFSANGQNARFHVLEGVGHWAMYEAPEALNELLLAG